MIEEAPSRSSTRRRARRWAREGAWQGVQYKSAGTVEFIVDKHRKFYFSR